MKRQIMCEPISARILAVPRLGNMGIIMLPKEADPILAPAIHLQNLAPHQVKFHLHLHVVEAEDNDGLNLSAGMYLSLDFQDRLEGTLLIPWAAPYERWVGALTANAEILLTSNSEIIEALDVPAYKRINLNRHMMEIVDTDTFPLKLALNKLLPMRLRQLAGSPTDHTVSHEIAAAFDDYLRRVSSN